MKQEPGKRIVSKGEYVGKCIERSAETLVGSVFLLIAFFSIVVAVCVGSYLLFILILMNDSPNNLFAWVFGMGMASILGYGSYVIGSRAIKRADHIEPGLPFTRANTTNLPAPDSLVRASQEPQQVQQSVLLRAARETKEKQEELLRASAGGQE